jgi:hypothetical protein
LQPGKRMVLQIKRLPEDTDEALLKKFVQTISAANDRLGRGERDVRIWVEFA